MILPQQRITECSADKVEHISELKEEADNQELLDALLQANPSDAQDDNTMLHTEDKTREAAHSDLPYQTARRNTLTQMTRRLSEPNMQTSGGMQLIDSHQEKTMPFMHTSLAAENLAEKLAEANADGPAENVEENEEHVESNNVLRTSTSDVLLKLIGKVSNGEQDATIDEADQNRDASVIDNYASKGDEPNSSGMPVSHGFWPGKSLIENGTTVFSMPYGDKNSTSRSPHRDGSPSKGRSSLAQKLRIANETIAHLTKHHN